MWIHRVFDTLGDAYGWKIAIGPAIGIAMFPVLLHLCFHVQHYIRAEWFAVWCRKGKEGKDIELREENSFLEMLPSKKFRAYTEQMNSGVKGRMISQESVILTDSSTSTSNHIQAFDPKGTQDESIYDGEEHVEMHVDNPMVKHLTRL